MPPLQETSQHVDMKMLILARCDHCAEKTNPDDQRAGCGVSPKNAIIEKVPEAYLDECQAQHHTEEGDQGDIYDSRQHAIDKLNNLYHKRLIAKCVLGTINLFFEVRSVNIPCAAKENLKRYPKR